MKRKILILLLTTIFTTLTTYADGISIIATGGTIFNKGSEVNQYEGDNANVEPEPPGAGVFEVSDINESSNKGGSQYKIKLQKQKVNMNPPFIKEKTQDEIIKNLKQRLLLNVKKEFISAKNINLIKEKLKRFKGGSIRAYLETNEAKDLYGEIQKREINLQDTLRSMKLLSHVYKEYGQRLEREQNNIAKLAEYRKEYINSVMKFYGQLEDDYVLATKDYKQKYIDKDYSKLTYKELRALRYDEILKRIKKSSNLAQNYYGLYSLMNENVESLNYTATILNQINRLSDFDQIEIQRAKRSKQEVLSKKNSVIHGSFENTIEIMNAFKSGDYTNLPEYMQDEAKKMYKSRTKDVIKEIFE